MRAVSETRHRRENNEERISRYQSSVQGAVMAGRAYSCAQSLSLLRSDWMCICEIKTRHTTPTAIVMPSDYTDFSRPIGRRDRKLPRCSVLLCRLARGVISSSTMIVRADVLALPTDDGVRPSR